MPTVPEAVRPPVDLPPRADLGEWARIRARIVVTDRCWVYCGALSDDGYGRFWTSSAPSVLPTVAPVLELPENGADSGPLQLSLWAPENGARPTGAAGVTSVPVTEVAGSAGRVVRPSRWMWQAYNGPIPDGHVIRHDCDRSWCTRPACLRLGDQVDNLADAMRRDRVTHPGRVGKADRRGAEVAARAVRTAVLGAVQRGVCDPAELGTVVAGALDIGDPFAGHETVF